MIEYVPYLALFGGLVYLLIGGDLLVRGAIGFSLRTEISPVVVGLTVVAFGTSAPELFVSVFAALSGLSAIAIGNVVGSNIANVLLVLGIPALIYPMITTEPGLKQNAIFMLAITVLFVALCFLGSLGWAVGLLFLAILVIGGWLTLKGKAALPGLDDAIEEGETLERGLGLDERTWVIVLFIVLGIIALPLGADMTVDAAATIAKRLGVSEAVIASSLVALGTSLPELSTTVIAAMHRSASIALGNVIGSNVLNILAIMGITTLLATVEVPSVYLHFDLWVMLGATVLLTVMLLRQWPISRPIGAGLLVLYAGYFAWIYT